MTALSFLVRLHLSPFKVVDVLHQQQTNHPLLLCSGGSRAKFFFLIRKNKLSDRMTRGGGAGIEQANRIKSPISTRENSVKRSTTMMDDEGDDEDESRCDSVAKI